jgi:hypothetical protein
VLQEEVDPSGHVVGGVAGEADDQVDQQGNSHVVKHLRRRGQPDGEFLLKWVSRSGNDSLFSGVDSVGNGQYLMEGLSMILDGNAALVTGAGAGNPRSIGTKGRKPARVRRSAHQPAGHGRVAGHSIGVS